MPSANEPDSREMTQLPNTTTTIRNSHDSRSSRSQGGGGHHSSSHHHPYAHDDSHRRTTRRTTADDLDQGSKRSNSDREAEGNESNSRHRTAPAVPDKHLHQRTTRSDSSDRRRERERPSGESEYPELPRERERAGSISSLSSSTGSLSSFEQLVRPGLQYEETEAKQDKIGRSSQPPSRSSTKDDSRPPLGSAQQTNTTPRPPRFQQPLGKPGDNRSSPDIAKQGGAQPTPTSTSQPPQVPTDNRPTTSISYAKVTATSTSGAPPQRDVQSRMPINEAEMANISNLPLNTQLPEGLEGLDIDPTEQIQALQEIEQAHIAEHIAAQQAQLQQQAEARDQGSLLGFGFAGALRNFLPSPGVLGPPRDKDWQRAIAEINHLRAELRHVKDEFRACRHAYHEAHAERLRLRESVGGLQHELSNVYKELEETKNLSEIRGRELVGAQVFLTKADSLSVSDVCEKVMVLNEEIFQTAASLGEVLTKVKRNLSEADIKKHFERSCAFVGEPLVSLLVDQARRPDPEVNMLIVQAALSVFLVGFCVSKLFPWHLTDKTIDGFLGNLYSEIRASEEQAVTGRWRALTHSKMRVSSEGWKAEIADSLKSVLCIAEWGSPNPKDQEVSFMQKLPPIFKAIEDVRTALGEKFTSADLEVNVVRSTAKFENVWMEDAYGDGRQAGGKKAKEEMVVGTTGIGLKKIVIDRERELPVKGHEMFENIVAPKVVLESTLRESLDPPPPASRGKIRRKKVEQEAPPAGGIGEGNNN